MLFPPGVEASSRNDMLPAVRAPPPLRIGLTTESGSLNAAAPTARVSPSSRVLSTRSGGMSATSAGIGCEGGTGTEHGLSSVGIVGASQIHARDEAFPEDGAIVSAIAADSARSIPREVIMHSAGSATSAVGSAASLEAVSTVQHERRGGAAVGNDSFEATSSFRGDLVGSRSNSAHTIIDESLPERSMEDGLGEILQRLALESVAIDESLTRSIRRVLQLGTVLSGQRLSDDEINSLPKVRFVSGERQHCAICLEAYRCGELLTALRCGHFFHVGCLRTWFQQSTQCPLCRTHAD